METFTMVFGAPICFEMIHHGEARSAAPREGHTAVISTQGECTAATIVTVAKKPHGWATEIIAITFSAVQDTFPLGTTFILSILVIPTDAHQRPNTYGSGAAAETLRAIKKDQMLHDAISYRRMSTTAWRSFHQPSTPNVQAIAHMKEAMRFGHDLAYCHWGAAHDRYQQYCMPKTSTWSRIRPNREP